MRELNIETKDDEGLYLCMELITGEGDDADFDVTTTAGMGGTTVILDVKDSVSGKSHRESFRISDLVEGWVGEILAELRA